MIGAAVGGLAFKELTDEVAAKPHTEAFARTVEACSIILWVRVDDKATENKASNILIAKAANNVHGQPAKSWNLMWQQ